MNTETGWNLKRWLEGQAGYFRSLGLAGELVAERIEELLAELRATGNPLDVATFRDRLATLKRGPQ